MTTDERVVAGATRARAVGPISLIAPVRDEEESITRLLDGVLRQTLRPDEVVIADGGSADRTREIVRERQAAYPVPLVLVEAGEAFPGRGRNAAIEAAAHQWIASIDAGIVPDAAWLEELAGAAAREPEAQIIYGRYEPVADSYFTECAAMAYVPRAERVRFIASSLFRRSAWRAAGGFPEDLRSAEDLLFFRSLDGLNVPAAYCPGAVVYWSIQPDLRRTFRRFATYSRYSMIAGLASEWQVRVSLLYALMAAVAVVGALFWKPLLALPPLVLLLRAARRVHNWRRGRGLRTLAAILDPRRVLTVAWIAFVIDVATFRGLLDWLLKDGARTRKGGAPGPGAR
jgi:glycosyltransferase involved in cell wall biosynthesis